ncbi:MAG: flagellar hook-basal body complex protein FliE [Proteobacteria bacterium]|nr:flagellar hook-basal body complex protein FliE [Pseudomonadota bacterium]
MTISALSSVQALVGADAGTSQAVATQGGFLNLIDSALRNVSSTQNAAATAESGYTVGATGSTLGGALVASDRAQVAWNATVAVRNEVVAAYQSIMSMQF